MSITLVFPGVRIVSRSWLWRSLPRPNCRGSQRKFRRVSPRTAGAAQGFQGDFGWGTGFLQRMGTVSEHGEKMRENMFFVVFLCIEILGKWRKFTEMIIWVDGKSWKMIQVARQSHPRRGYPEQRPQDLAWRPSRIALSKDGKLGNLTKWRFLAGKLTINGDVQLPCLITGGYASQCWRNTIRQNAGGTTCFLLCACSFFSTEFGCISFFVVYITIPPSFKHQDTPSVSGPMMFGLKQRISTAHDSRVLTSNSGWF